MNKIFSQIISLTKNIYLREPKKELGYKAQFFVGKQKPFSFSGGFAISWWYTKMSFALIENVAFMIIRDFEEFSGCDHESIKDIIQNTLNEICVDKRIFDGDDVCFSRKETLFSCKACDDTSQYALIITEEIFSNIRKNITSWCIAYAAPRVSGESFSIESEKIHVIKRTDDEYWKAFETKKYETNNWNPISGNYSDGETTPFSGYSYNYLFVSEELGTSQGCKFSSSLKLKKLLSVIFSVISEQQKYKLTKSSADSYKLCLQFPHIKSSSLGISMSEIGALLPYYIKDYPLNSDDIKKVKCWYESEAKLESEAKNRIEKCAHFINHAMNSNNIESYINYFISLDALFGNKGSVEESITNGVNKLPNDLGWNKKISWLFNLRNELVHGGSRYIKEWPKFIRYYRHFSTEPLDDMEKLAFTLLYYSPHLLVK